MTEFRRDPIIGQWVLVKTEQSLTPDDYPKEKRYLRQGAICPFCPEREHLTPPEVGAIRQNGSEPNSQGWDVRVVSNKFPALKIEGHIDHRMQGIFELANGIGAHEVLIETTDHKKQMADYSDHEMGHVFRMYQMRLNDLTGDDRFKYIVMFKNYGESAGASIEHAHSQIIALPMIPKYVLEELEGTVKYYQNYKRCVYCDVMKQEMESKEHVVCENEHFLVICPYVSRYSFECWLLPKNHNSRFSQLPEDQLASLAGLFRDVLKRLKNCLSDPSFNYYLHLRPINITKDDPDHLQEKSVEESYHWHIEIVPQIHKLSGFEWGSGYFVVQTSPHLAAKYLRDTSL